MGTYQFTIKNNDTWAITNTEIVVVADNKVAAKIMLKKEGYYIEKTSELTELETGVHIVQNKCTE
jgi:hypothetical protein